MRPLIVLAIVLAAGAAFLFAFLDPGTTGAPQDVLEGPTAPVEQQPEEPSPAADLVGPAVQPGREEAAPARVDVLDNEPAAAVEAGLTGFVVDGDGNGIADAQVTLTRYGQTNVLFLDAEIIDRSGDKTVKTDGSGRFTFTRIEPYDSYALMVRHPEFAPVEEGGVQVQEGEVNETPPIQLGAGVALRGQIKDSAGNTVQGAQLVLSQMALTMSAADDPNAQTGTTDPQGNYEFKHLASGNYVLQVSADGYGQSVVGQIHVAGDGDVTRDVTLEIAMMLAGIVTDQEGSPIPEAMVTAYSIGNRESRTQTQARTEASGEFNMIDVPRGTYTIRVQANGYKIGQVARAEAGDVGLHITLVRLPQISGQAVDAQTGAPLTNFAVTLRHGNDSAIENTIIVGPHQNVKHPEGRFSVTAPKDGPFMVEVKAGGYSESVSSVFTVAEGQDLQGIVVQVKRGGGIRGIIVDSNGNPIARALVRTYDDRWTGSDFDRAMGTFPGVATDRRARTNSKGEFSLDGLTPTTYLVQIDHPQYAGAAVKNIIVGEGVYTDLGAKPLLKGGILAGVVRDASGAALPGAQVKLMMSVSGASEFPAQYSGKADKNGAYRITGVRPGTYFIHATRPIRGGDNPFAHSNDIKNTRRQIVVGDGQQLQGVDFSLSN